MHPTTYGPPNYSGGIRENTNAQPTIWETTFFLEYFESWLLSFSQLQIVAYVVMTRCFLLYIDKITNKILRIGYA